MGWAQAAFTWLSATVRVWATFLARDYGLDYLEFRLWIGLWVAFFGLVLVATEASHLVQYFTRFTEEGFCALISLIFIYDSLKKMLSLAEAFPINWHYRADDVTLYSCTCNLSVPGECKLLSQLLPTHSAWPLGQVPAQCWQVGSWAVLTGLCLHRDRAAA